MLDTRKFETKHSTNWLWPLEIAVLRDIGAENLIKEINQFYWPSELSRVFELNKVRRHCNILFLRGDFDKSIEKLINFKGRIRVELIVFFCHSTDKYNRLSENEILSLGNLVQANGLFFTDNIDGLADWCNGLIVELSHNSNIVEAIETINKPHANELLYVTNRLIWNSKLKNYSRRLIKNFRAVSGEMDLFTLDDGTKINIKDEVDILANNLENFQFDHESGEATFIADISRRIESQVPRNMLEFDSEEEFIESDFDTEATRVLGTIEVESSGEMDDEIEKVEKIYNIEEIGESDFNGEPALGPGEDIIDPVPPLPPLEVEDEVKDEDIVPRYIQSQIVDGLGNKVYDVLKVKTSYGLNVRIGPSDRQWLQGNRKAPVEKLFEEEKNEQELLIVLKTNLDKDVQYMTIDLPVNGSSEIATFKLNTPDVDSELAAEISVYHRNRLLQSAVLSAYIVDNTNATKNRPTISMDIVSANRLIINNLENRSNFASSIRYGIINSPHESQIVSSKGVDYRIETGLKKILKNITEQIEEVVEYIDDYPQDILDEKNREVFLVLAHLGRELYDSYLKDVTDFDGPIQIISGTSDHIPLEMLYTFPAPDPTAEVCKKSVKALKEDGKCKGCFDLEKTPAPIICPFGFLGYSKIIERHAIDHKDERIESADFAIYSEPYSKRQSLDILQSTLFGSSSTVEKKAKGIINETKEKIIEVVGSLEEASNWETWKDQIKKQKPQCLVLMVHTEKHPIIRTEQMEIGEKEFLLKTLVIEEHVINNEIGPGPVVVLIGCTTQDNDKRGFDFTAAFKNHGASIVLSNFTVIRGRHAAPIVKNLYDVLNKYKGKEMTFGKLMLRIRQCLLSEGMIASFSLVAHGDADWKLKI